ncbi:hypothetical protein [Pseudohongiella nitratireducens]|uniref:hypothetical protein n=1 Tax=Pseudohongiella nitratireducens TaxID=1768907 RepID=UPI0030EDBF59|tara:strand:- start:376 stop:762 length:387 start_codon:yes stop_codon:yes gene_type:complete
MSLQNILQTFAVINPNKQVSTEIADSSLYQRLNEDYNSFKGCELVSCYTFDKDWDSWENHPAGDELVILMSGLVTFVIESGGETRETCLSKPGDYVVVPKGHWHTARLSKSSTVLFITPGEDTQHRSA